MPSITKKIRSIEAFKGLKTPAIETADGMIPDFSSRYFTADFSYGLTIIAQIADLIDLDIPYIKRVLLWYKSISLDSKEFNYSDYGINSRTDLVTFYSK